MNPSTTTPQATTALQARIDAVYTYDNFGEFDSVFREENKSVRESIVEAIKDLLDYVHISDENYPRYVREQNDLWDSKNEDGHYFCDLADEWADSMVDIYHYDLWKNAYKFSAFEEDLLGSYGSESVAHIIETEGITALLQHIQIFAYSYFASTLLQSLACNPEEA